MTTFTPKFMPSYGTQMVPGRSGDVALPYYRVVKMGDSNGANFDTKITLAGVGDTPFGVVVPDVADYHGNSDGSESYKVSYVAGELPKVYTEGIVYVQVAGAVTSGQELVAAANGFASTYVPVTNAVFTSGYSAANEESIRDEHNLVIGVALSSAADQGYVKVQISVRR